METKSQTYYEINKSKIQVREKIYRENSKDKRRNRDLKERYGINLEAYKKMFEEQHGCCKICGNHQLSLSKRLAVDHCHNTGIIRGLLCNNCNIAVGMLKDNPILLRKAAQYLEDSK